MSDGAALQIIHISDLHLTPNISSVSKLVRLLTLHPPPILGWVLLHKENFTITRALPLDLRTIAGDIPTVVAISGDIGTSPEDSTLEINAYHYPFVQSLLQNLPCPLGLIPTLGNHDWGPAWVPGVSLASSFRKSNFDDPTCQFQLDYDIPFRHFKVFRDGPLILIIFVIDSNIMLWPPWGKITQVALRWLQDRFAEGDDGKLGDANKPDQRLTDAEFKGAIKILLLHHPPLDYSAYRGTMNFAKYLSHRLRNWQQLLQECRNYIDIFLFGHMHVPVVKIVEGFVMVGSGTTTALVRGKLPTHQNCLNRIKIFYDQSIEVETLFWNGRYFYPRPDVCPCRLRRPPGQTGWECV